MNHEEAISEISDVEQHFESALSNVVYCGETATLDQVNEAINEAISEAESGIARLRHIQREIANASKDQA